MLTEDGAINILAGNALGGGGTVNWFCSLDTPHYVRDEWSNKYGLKHFESPKFAKHLLSAKNLLGVQTSHVIHNKANNVLLKGCKELGFHCETAPQQGYPTGDENLCCMGSKRGERQGMLGSLLYDAAKTGNLRVFYECRANSVLTTTIGGKKKAIGVDAVSRSKHPITLRSKIVVSACGSLHTPLLLRRSGLVNKHIGRNLRLHPVTGVYAQFKEEINAFEGAPMTTVSNVVANLDGKGYGARLEVPSIHPSLMASSLNWRGAAAAKADMLKALRFSLLIVLTRDSGSGRVYSDAKHQPRIEYSLRRKDANHMIKGVEMACRVLMAAGAEVIHTVQSGIEAYHCTDQGVADPTFHKWIKRVKQVGPKPNQCPLFSAHQMGTCKMGINPTQGGVKPSGETWEVDGLYVCDTSVFPTPSGTNPMVTVAAVTYGISQNLRLALARLKRATVDLRSKL
uniref:Long-chain-alcohol oxidase n=1 Tax=Amorphochlora amoebiformis TaxID=1561963 RepID=A0A7S0GZP3_9EUKA|mmetsp:Transcript_24102/g.37954  ORF Transcript_24102/g.37954 Transcript_24102/m.37954 type:complete len:455 (+) Transcript_24102:737-2101(+)